MLIFAFLAKAVSLNKRRVSARTTTKTFFFLGDAEKTKISRLEIDETAHFWNGHLWP